jgi:tetratricopeptide (TPR) repeat protein
LIDRYHSTGHLPDLLGAVDALRQLVRLNPQRGRDTPAARFLLSIALRELFDATDDVSVLQEAVEVGVAAARVMPPDQPSYATGVLNLAIALRDLGQRTQNPALVDDAIGYGRWGAGALLPAHPLRPDACCDLSMALSARYKLTGDIAALREAISVAWQALEIVPRGHAQYVSGPYRLAGYLQQLYRETQDPGALDNAIKISRWGVQISYGDPHHGDHLRQLADLLRDTYSDRHDLDALREAIYLLRTAAAHLPGETRNAVMILMSLGAALESLGSATEDADIIRDAVQSLRTARAACGADTTLAAVVDHNLARALRSLYGRTSRPDVLAEAVHVGRQALQGTPRAGAARGERAGQLALLLADSANASGGDTSLEDEVISLFREAVRTTRGLALQTYRYGLWRALRSRYNRRGGLSVLEEAVEQLRAVLAVADPRDDLYSAFQYSLGTSLVALHEQTSAAQTLAEAIRALRDAVAAAAAGDQDRYLRRRASLAVALVSAAHADHAVAVLDEAIEMLSGVIAAGGEAPDPVNVSNLVDALLVKFDHTGQLACLEEAIDAGRRAVALAPDDPTILSNLAGALNGLFSRTGQRGAGDEALSLLRRAAGAVPPTHPNAAAVFANISLTMSGLAERLGELALQDEALGFARRAAAAAPSGHQARAIALNNLGSQLTDRFSRRGQDADLREAIALLTEAAGIADQAPRGVVLNNLARATGRVGEENGDEALLREAVRLGRQALADADSPAQQAQISAELGLHLHKLMALSGDGSLLEEILGAYARAAAAADAAPRLRLQVARARAEILADARRWPEALEDYVTAIGLVGQVAARHLPAEDKQHQLASLTALGADAAACALNVGQPQRAFELAEHARGVLIAEAFDAHADVSELRARAPDLAARFEALRDDLNTVGLIQPRVMAITADGERETDGPAVPAESQHRLGQRWNDLLGEIRSLPGFEMFLRPPPFETLAAAAAAGPVALLNLSRFRCDALILSNRADGHADVQLVPLPEVDPMIAAGHAGAILSEVHDAVSALAATRAVHQTLAWLWNAVVRPVLDSQGLLAANPPAPLPRIWWCPTGALSYLPLHAAGLPDTSTEHPDSALDHVVSSYTPSIRALLQRSRRDHGDGAPVTALIVAMPTTPGGADLPGVAAETQLVQAACPEALVLAGPQAHREAVVAALADRSLAHFACHAVSDESDPSSSQLVLYDHQRSPLTVADIIQCETTAAELAFLSACSTAQTSADLIDEALHITSAFQVAGFPQVVGTLWPVRDLAAAGLVGDFYARYLPDGGRVPAETAAYALHEAIRQARDRDQQSPLSWAAYMHVGR